MDAHHRWGAAAAEQRMPRLRLTARGRMVRRFAGWTGAVVALVVVATVAILVGSAMLAPGAEAGDGSSGSPNPTVDVVVAPGDSLWSLALRHQPDRDPREVVADIERLNGLPAGSMLPAGAALLVPIG